MPTNQQRREAERRRLQRQLEERRAREAQRKRYTLIGSVIGTLVAIGAIIGIVLATTGGSDKGPQSGGNSQSGADTVSGSPSPSTVPSPTTSAPTTPAALPAAPCAAPPKGDKATFQGVTVTGATDLKHAPKVQSLSQRAPATLTCEDLVVGKGKPAGPTSTVSVQYTGVLYKDGTQFDSSWSRGAKPVSFSLAQVVPGFTQGIGGAGKAAPMRVGGRRIMILPASLGYGASGNGSIPANAPLVFIVDLTSVS